MDLNTNSAKISMVDRTAKYVNMIEGFKCDFVLAMNDDSRFCLDDLQVLIERGDKRLLSDIELLKELSLELRYGRLKIVKQL